MRVMRFVVVFSFVLFSVAVYSPAATFTVTSLSDANVPGTLRAALNSAKALGVDTIAFNVPAPYKISVTGELPHIDTFPGTIVDGTTQPGYAGTPIVHICGTGYPFSAYGLYVNSDSNLIRGLKITDFTASGIYINQGNSNVIESCHILSNDYAQIRLYDGDDNHIGGVWLGAGNVLGGGTHGIYIEGECQRTVIRGNLIGTDATGTNRCGFDQYGIQLGASSNTQIGDTNFLGRNVISGAGRDGIDSGDGVGGGHLIVGNYIGTDALGTSPISNLWAGISLKVPNCTIGGTNENARNIISGNREGISLWGTNANHTQIYGNYIGVDVTGMQDLGNADGISLYGVNKCEIGSSLPGGGNVISANRQVGIDLSSGSHANEIANNLVGTDASGTNALGNGAGISLGNCGTNTIGGSVSARNYVAGNIGRGISSDYSTGIVIRANYVGLGVGAVPLGNGDDGVRLRYVNDFDVGGTIGSHGNIIGHNDGDGVLISLCTNGYVRRNFIGLTGSAVASNTGYGLYLGSASQVEVRDNTIVASGANGVDITQSSHLLLANNYIGTDSLGTPGIGNDDYGVYVGFFSVSNEIGGVDGVSGNVISGNGLSGIALNESSVSNTLIAGNKLGTDAGGTAAIPNAGAGISISGSKSTTIGGTNAWAGNLISGNDSSGILIGSASMTVVQGNTIGADVTGLLPMPNANHGIYLSSSSSNNLIGGLEETAGNLIAFNRESGIMIYSGVPESVCANTILGNRIMRNEDMGIDLGYDDVTANDSQDPDTGENRLQNFPVLQSATNNGATVTVVGALDSTPSTDFTVEIFGSRDPDLTGYGEGEFLMGRTNVTTSAGGTVGFTSVVAVAGVTPNFLTATATADVTGDTSEFSQRLFLDSDGDGMGDGFEDEYFGGPTAGDPNAHGDADGINNLGEFLAETDPVDGFSYLRITRIWREFGDWYFTISASDTRNYSYQLNRDLSGAPHLNWWDWGSSPSSRTNGAATFRDGSGITTDITCYRVHAIVP